MVFRVFIVFVGMFFSGVLFCQESSVQNTLTSFTLESTILSEAVTISLYKTGSEEDLPLIYITDGQKMLNNGALERIKTLTAAGKVPKAAYVFVSTISPKTNMDNRNTFFFCNNGYIRFFEEELVPQVEKSFFQSVAGATGNKHRSRSLVGISFGGLNAAYFSGKTRLFQNYGLLSPITYPCEEALKAIAFSENRALKIFISTGKNDAENYTGPLIRLYTSKGYNVKSITTEGGHDFDNWNGQWKALLNHFDDEND